MSAVIVVVGTISLLTGIANAQNRRTSGAPRNGTITSVLDPIHVPKTLPELVALSPLIVVATSQGDAPSRFFIKGNFRCDVVTDRMVQVESVVKGTVPAGTVIAIEELGGGVSQYDGVHSLKQVIVNQRPLQPQHRYLLFLRPASQAVGDIFDGRRFSITGIWAGSFELMNGQVSVNDAAEPGLRQVNGSTETSVISLVRNAIASSAGQ